MFSLYEFFVKGTAHSSAELAEVYFFLQSDWSDTILPNPTSSYTILHDPTQSYTILHGPTRSYKILQLEV